MRIQRISDSDATCTLGFFIAFFTIVCRLLFSVHYLCITRLLYRFDRSLCSISGKVLWRRVLEQDDAGEIHAVSGVADGDLISISGREPTIVRSWNLATGHILNEWPIPELNPERFVNLIVVIILSRMLRMSIYKNIYIRVISQMHVYRIKDTKWYVKNATIHHILPVYNTGIQVTSYDIKSGERLKSKKIAAAIITRETE